MPFSFPLFFSFSFSKEDLVASQRSVLSGLSLPFCICALFYSNMYNDYQLAQLSNLSQLIKFTVLAVGKCKLGNYFKEFMRDLRENGTVSRVQPVRFSSPTRLVYTVGRSRPDPRFPPCGH